MADCAWCGEPATTTVVLEPARMGFVKHPIHGPQRTTVKKAITAACCAQHAQIRDGEPGVLRPDPRRTPASTDGQTTIYDMLGE